MVTYYPGQTDLDTLIGRIRNLGYDAQPKQSKKIKQHVNNKNLSISEIN